MRKLIACAAAAFALLPLTSLAEVTFSASEIKLILSHGPWPVPPRADPTNRASGNIEAIELGARLFFDQRVSSSGRVACATCRVPERNWSDNLRRCD